MKDAVIESQGTSVFRNNLLARPEQVHDLVAEDTTLLAWVTRDRIPAPVYGEPHENLAFGVGSVVIPKPMEHLAHCEIYPVKAEGGVLASTPLKIKKPTFKLLKERWKIALAGAMQVLRSS